MNILVKHKFELLIILALCVIAFYLRSYALYRDLFFAFDQGRDAWEMVKMSQGDFTLIGPVTGLSGVFLGPFWYYMLFPLYLIGNGNPVIATVGTIGLHALLVALIYSFGKRIGGFQAGAIAAVLFVFSFSNIMFSRWLSNPNPLPFFALLAFFIFWKALESKRWIWFFGSGILFGLCMQLEAANAVWFIPTAGILLAYELFFNQTKILFKQKCIQFLWFGITLGGGFLLTALPQLLFELKSNFLITKNVITAFQTTHNISLIESFPKRIVLLFTLYSRGIFGEQIRLGIPLLVGILALGILLKEHFVRNRGLRILLLWFCIPLFFHSIYTGNFGNFWDYYIIAQHVPLYLLIGSLLGIGIATLKTGKMILLIGTLLLLSSSIGFNLMRWSGFLTPFADRFSFQMQVDATHWIINESKDSLYGTWVYTPDAQDQAHRYVYHWIGKQGGSIPEEHVEQQPLIYLVVEDDGWHPQRRQEWIDNNLKFGEVLKMQKFGAITVYKLKNTYITSK